MADLSHICDLHHSSWQCHQILNPLSKARDQTHILLGPSCISFPLHPNRNSLLCFWKHYPSKAFQDSLQLVPFGENQSASSLYWPVQQVIIKVIHPTFLFNLEMSWGPFGRCSSCPGWAQRELSLDWPDDQSWWHVRVTYNPAFLLFSFLFIYFFRAAHAAYGGSQARGLIRATAAGLHQSHSNVGFEPHMWPTPQLMGMPDP